MSILLIIVGLVGLVVGSDVTVQAAKRVAAHLGVSPLVIGLTIASIGTSVPEIATNLSAAFNSAGGVDASGIAVGNIIGSNLSQITVLLGITALLGTMTVSDRALWRDGLALFVALGLMFITAVDGTTTRIEGIALCIGYVGYLYILRLSSRNDPEASSVDDRAGRLSAHLTLTILGLVVVAFSADLIVDHGVAIARALGTSEIAIGLGIGLGTGLPELTVAIRSVRAGCASLALGNLVGSNIADPLLSYGLGATVHDITVPHEVLVIDFPFWAGATAIAFLFMMRRKSIVRLEGLALVLVFIIYVAVRSVLVIGQ